MKRQAFLPRFTPLVVLLGCTVAMAASPTPYSDGPLRRPPIMTSAEVAVDLVKFNAWLSDQVESLSPQQIPAVREHAYLLIDSILKSLCADARSTPSGFEQQALTSLFNWGTRLGVYGAGLAARQIGGQKKDSGLNVLYPPEPFRLRLEYPYFLLRADDALWEMQVPYYFMIWNAQRFTATNGLTTELVIISTSFAPHSDGKGSSQATIMMIFSPGTAYDEFKKYWLEKLGLDLTARVQSGVPRDSENFQGYDSEQRMRKEITFFKDADGVYGVVYNGLDGTYQANHVSYEDFLRALRRGETSNLRLDPPVRPVTGLANDARPAPVRPEGQPPR